MKTKTTISGLKTMVTLLLFVINVKVSLSQNLVTNASFENYTSCPGNVAQLPNAIGWDNITNQGGSADYFHMCSTGIVSVPVSFIGNEMPATGSGYVGMALFYTASPEFREYIQTQLSSPMIAGVTYNLSMQYSLADESKYATDDFGCHFSVNPLVGSGNSFSLPFVPQAKSSIYLNTKTGWNTLTLSYTALGGEQYLTFGNFFDDANTTTTPFPGSFQYDVCYLFIDDVSLAPANLYVTGDSTICYGDSTILAATNSGYYFWALSTNPNNVFSTDSILTLSPDSTTSYIIYDSNDTLTYTIYVDYAPTLNLGNDTTVCIGSTFIIDASSSGASSYTWQNGNTNSSISVNTSGAYYVTASSNGCIAIDTLNVTFSPCALPVVQIAASDSSWCEKQAIDFFDFSTNNPTSWQWTFNGAAPNTSTDQNPTGIYYASYGSFDVKLLACNAAGCDSLTLTNFVTEHQSPPAPLITISNDTLYCSQAVTYAWYNTNNTTLVLSTNQYFYPPALLQSYFVIITDSNGCSTPSGVLVSGVHESFNSISGLSVIQNETEIVINNLLQTSVEITLIDAMGKLVFAKKTNNTYFNIDTAIITKGVYHLRCVANGKVFDRKISLR